MDPPSSFTRRERLMATLRGEPVDRPAVNLLEIGGLKMDPTDLDPFNVYQDPSWRPLIELGESQTDLIRLRSAVRAKSHEAWDRSGQGGPASVRDELLTAETYIEDGCRMNRISIAAGDRKLTCVTRRERDVDTLWTAEPFLKSHEDLMAYLELPDEFFDETIDVTPLVTEEEELGERGIVMVDTEDPLCAAATLFHMQDYTVTAFTESHLFHRLLEKLARPIHAQLNRSPEIFRAVSDRIYGPEYASEPYLPPSLFREYVVRYVRPMIESIHRYGGFARIHCHGRIRNLLDDIAEMGADAIDPIEPPPHGDVELEYVRERYGDRFVLFGNLEVADIENMEPARFDKMVCQSLEEGTRGTGRGFVLMPSAAPFGRRVADRAL